MANGDGEIIDVAGDGCSIAGVHLHGEFADVKDSLHQFSMEQIAGWSGFDDAVAADESR